MRPRRRRGQKTTPNYPTMCPTCGGRWPYLRVRAKGIARLLASDLAPLNMPKFPGIDAPAEERRAWAAEYRRRDQERKKARRSLRVYWPRERGFARCPDPWHDPPPGSAKPAEAERFTTINVHARPERLAERRKAKARRHKSAQSKEKR